MKEKEIMEIADKIIQKYLNKFKAKEIPELKELKDLVFEDFEKLAPNQNYIIKNSILELVELLQQHYVLKEIFEQDLPNLLKEDFFQ
ncbi:MAG: hypothetical protein IJZ29_04425 [Clostridia bacterium]|nr:hypothetical protein [Clostridia bacterium]